MPAAPAPDSLFRHDWREQINLAIRDFLQQHGTSLQALDRNDRVALIGALDGKGLFEARNAAPLIAQALGISRASVYGLLAAAREEPPRRKTKGTTAS